MKAFATLLSVTTAKERTRPNGKYVLNVMSQAMSLSNDIFFDGTLKIHYSSTELTLKVEGKAF